MLVYYMSTKMYLVFKIEHFIYKKTTKVTLIIIFKKIKTYKKYKSLTKKQLLMKSHDISEKCNVAQFIMISTLYRYIIQPLCVLTQGRTVCVHSVVLSWTWSLHAFCGRDQMKRSHPHLRFHLANQKTRRQSHEVRDPRLHLLMANNQIIIIIDWLLINDYHHHHHHYWNKLFNRKSLSEIWDVFHLKVKKKKQRKILFMEMYP